MALENYSQCVVCWKAYCACSFFECEFNDKAVCLSVGKPMREDAFGSNFSIRAMFIIHRYAVVARRRRPSTSQITFFRFHSCTFRFQLS